MTNFSGKVHSAACPMVKAHRVESLLVLKEMGVAGPLRVSVISLV